MLVLDNNFVTYLEVDSLFLKHVSQSPLQGVYQPRLPQGILNSSHWSAQCSVSDPTAVLGCSLQYSHLKGMTRSQNSSTSKAYIIFICKITMDDWATLNSSAVCNGRYYLAQMLWFGIGLCINKKIALT